MMTPWLFVPWMLAPVQSNAGPRSCNPVVSVQRTMRVVTPSTCISPATTPELSPGGMMREGFWSGSRSGSQSSRVWRQGGLRKTRGQNQGWYAELHCPFVRLKGSKGFDRILTKLLELCVIEDAPQGPHAGTLRPHQGVRRRKPGHSLVARDGDARKPSLGELAAGGVFSAYMLRGPRWGCLG